MRTRIGVVALCVLAVSTGAFAQVLSEIHVPQAPGGYTPIARADRLGSDGGWYSQAGGPSLNAQWGNTFGYGFGGNIPCFANNGNIGDVPAIVAVIDRSSANSSMAWEYNLESAFAAGAPGFTLSADVRVLKVNLNQPATFLGLSNGAAGVALAVNAVNDVYTYVLQQFDANGIIVGGTPVYAPIETGVYLGVDYPNTTTAEIQQDSVYHSWSLSLDAAGNYVVVYDGIEVLTGAVAAGGHVGQRAYFGAGMDFAKIDRANDEAHFAFNNIVLAAVPEPASLCLLAIGAVALLRRR